MEKVLIYMSYQQHTLKKRKRLWSSTLWNWLQKKEKKKKIPRRTVNRPMNRIMNNHDDEYLLCIQPINGTTITLLCHGQYWSFEIEQRQPDQSRRTPSTKKGNLRARRKKDRSQPNATKRQKKEEARRELSYCVCTVAAIQPGIATTAVPVEKNLYTPQDHPSCTTREIKKERKKNCDPWATDAWYNMNHDWSQTSFLLIGRRHWRQGQTRVLLFFFSLSLLSTILRLAISRRETERPRKILWKKEKILCANALHAEKNNIQPKHQENHDSSRPETRGGKMHGEQAQSNGSWREVIGLIDRWA